MLETNVCESVEIGEVSCDPVTNLTGEYMVDPTYGPGVLLEWEGEDWRTRPQHARRAQLERLVETHKEEYKQVCPFWLQNFR